MALRKVQVEILYGEDTVVGSVTVTTDDEGEPELSAYAVSQSLRFRVDGKTMTANDLSEWLA